MVNPFPLARDRRGWRRNAHRNPMEPFRKERSGLYRLKMTRRAPRHIPDEKFSELFAALGSHRDRALVAFWVSAGARASELVGVTCGDVDPGQQLITVIRKGARALQQFPASRMRSCSCGCIRRRCKGLRPILAANRRAGAVVAAEATTPGQSEPRTVRTDDRPGQRGTAVSAGASDKPSDNAPRPRQTQPDPARQDHCPDVP